MNWLIISGSHKIDVLNDKEISNDKKEAISREKINLMVLQTALPLPAASVLL